jgi:hypothetical protein
MPKFQVTVTFDRINPTTKKLEKNSVREGMFFTIDAATAKAGYLQQFKKSEPTRRKIHKVVVKEIK